MNNEILDNMTLELAKQIREKNELLAKVKILQKEVLDLKKNMGELHGVRIIKTVIAEDKA